MITGPEALEALKALGNAEKAVQVAAYHKAKRGYFGVSNPDIDSLAKSWRGAFDLGQRLILAKHLWASDVHEARIVAAKLLTQARMRDDADVWAEISAWTFDFDGWAVADHACSAGSRRVAAEPDRLDEIEKWTTNPSKWVRRAALVTTLPWSKYNHPKPVDLDRRERILGWAAGYVSDPEWFIQKSVSWWLRSLSKHDPERVRQFLAEHGDGMKNFARKDAAKFL